MKKILRIVVYAVFYLGGLFFHYMELVANWFLGINKKTEYVLKGSCNKCGRCCHLLAVQYPKFFERLPIVVNTLIKWHQFRYNFMFRGKEEYHLLYECNWLLEGGRCKIYPFRPRLCREYPKMGFFGHPLRHAECGFYFERRDGKNSFDDILENLRRQKIK